MLCINITIASYFISISCICRSLSHTLRIGNVAADFAFLDCHHRCLYHIEFRSSLNPIDRFNLSRALLPCIRYTLLVALSENCIVGLDVQIQFVGLCNVMVRITVKPLFPEILVLWGAQLVFRIMQTLFATLSVIIHRCFLHLSLIVVIFLGFMDHLVILLGLQFSISKLITILRVITFSLLFFVYMGSHCIRLTRHLLLLRKLYILKHMTNLNLL